MTWFRDKIRSGLRIIRESAGEPVTYKTPALPPIDVLLAVRGAGEQVEDEENRITVSSDDLDWLIDRAELVSSGNEVVPAVGHTITCAEGDQAVTYVTTAGANKQCWEWSDAGHTQYRIHTKKIKSI